ncbi:MAG: Heparinase family protein, partial [Bryobacterales bacterium]|nr:Heparinase family protein [Bryobacterales bacterium]
MRSAREIRFRLAQQIANVLLLVKPPSQPRNARIADLSLPGCLNPEANGLESLAREALAHRFRLMGTTIDTGPAIEWRRDYVNGRVTGTSYFRFIPYLDFDRA